jgi:hypothetical protein
MNIEKIQQLSAQYEKLFNFKSEYRIALMASILIVEDENEREEIRFAAAILCLLKLRVNVEFIFNHRIPQDFFFTNYHQIDTVTTAYCYLQEISTASLHTKATKSNTSYLATALRQFLDTAKKSAIVGKDGSEYRGMSSLALDGNLFPSEGTCYRYLPLSSPIVSA